MWNGGHHSEHGDESRRLSIELALARHTGAASYDYDDEDHNASDQSDDDQSGQYESTGYASRPHHSADEDDDSDDDDDDDDDDPPQPIKPRGKPEAMAARLASRLREKYQDLEPERETEIVAQPLEEPGVGSNSEAMAISSEGAAPPPAPAPKKKKKRPVTPKKSSPPPSDPAFLTMEDPVDPISKAEYQNLEDLMIQFCRVPLLAEFSRPVSLLHPELMAIYSKIVDHPIDLGKVCRKIRRRQYRNLRDARIDVWRIFANCVKYHSHHSNKEAVPSFVSIALHLRDYFNDLWQEYMLPSDPPPSSGKSSKNSRDAQRREAFAKRAENRKRRMVVSSLSVMTGKCLERSCVSLSALIRNGCRVDDLDTDRIFGHNSDSDDELSDEEISTIKQNLKKLHSRLTQITEEGEDYGIDELERDVRKCYADEILEDNPALRKKVANRLDRWIGKIVVPIHEATCRGVSQSSIWGCMAAGVWARESSKKPYWPALVLGIMAPEDQREEWHNALTERNEARLPEKLRNQLGAGKRKAEQALKKQSQGQMEPQSFFLVEFLGTHEFIWVKESDIQENFDPNDDPNQQVRDPGSKKKRASRSSVASVIGSKMYASAVEEAKWALEEFELQLQDVGGDIEEDEDSEEMNYSYSVLCQSDDEADDEIGDDDIDNLDVDECNELLATDGLLDFSVEGRKNAKKRAQAMKKQKADAERKLKADKAKKQKAEMSKKKKDARAKERESKKEQRDLEKKRRKRARERDRAIKGTEQKNKKRRVSDSDDIKKSASGRRNLIAGKRERATAIVEGYLNRAIEREDYKTLCLGGVMTIPASLIDSSGIFGMALAFRAAAGELPMPEESGDQAANVKPWDAIKVERQKTSNGRCALLQKQIALLQKEIKDRKSAIARRKELAKDMIAKCKSNVKMLKEADALARLNPLKKKKAPPSSEKKKARISVGGAHGKAQENGTSGNGGRHSPSVASAEGSHAADADLESTGDWQNGDRGSEKHLDSDLEEGDD